MNSKIWERYENQLNFFKYASKLFEFEFYNRNTLKKWAMSWENLFLSYVNNKGTDQPAHPHSLTSTFVVHSLDSTISILAISKMLRP